MLGFGLTLTLGVTCRDVDRRGRSQAAARHRIPIPSGFMLAIVTTPFVA
jgi:hypothetical protein